MIRSTTDQSTCHDLATLEAYSSNPSTRLAVPVGHPCPGGASLSRWGIPVPVGHPCPGGASLSRWGIPVPVGHPCPRISATISLARIRSPAGDSDGSKPRSWGARGRLRARLRGGGERRRGFPAPAERGGRSGRTIRRPLIVRLITVTRSWAAGGWPTRSWPTRSWPTRSWPTRSWPTRSWPTRIWPTRIWPTRSRPKLTRPAQSSPPTVQPERHPSRRSAVRPPAH